MNKKILIIGAGIAGLSAGCYARMNGYDTEIYEMHSKPGGLCTAWKRSGYTVDGCLHWLTGSAPGSMFYNFWEELGAVQNKKMYNPEIFLRFVDKDNRIFNLYTDVDRLEKHMIEFSPRDEASSIEFCRLIRVFSLLKMDMNKARELMNIFDMLKMMKNLKPGMKELIYCIKTSNREFAEKFQDPILSECIMNILAPETSLIALVMTMAGLNTRSSGFPEGGSFEFTKSIENRYLGLGGKIFYNKKAEKILVKNNKAYGIRLEDGSEISSDIVISGSDLKTVLDKLLEGKFNFPMYSYLFDNTDTIPTTLQVSFGINRDIADDSDAVAVIYKLSDPIEIAGNKKEYMFIRNYHFDKTMSPEGKTFMMSLITTDYDYWENLYRDKEAYQKEKDKIAEAVLDVIDSKYPGTRALVEVVDVVTPMTYYRYTGNWKGRFMSWIMNPGNAGKLQIIPKRVKGLNNFYMTGMWVMAPGGVPSGVKTARDVIQIICRKDRRRFNTSKPEAVFSQGK